MDRNEQRKNRMTKSQFEYELRKNEILEVLDNAKEPMTAQEVSDKVYMSTAKTSALLLNLYNEGLVNKDSIVVNRYNDKRNVYWTHYTRKHKRINDNDYAFPYNLYRKLINFINERKPHVE